MPIRRLIAVLSAALCVVVLGQSAATASGTAQPTPVNAVPSAATPNVLDGVVFAIAKVGNTVVLGGSFTSVANPGSTTAVTDPTNGKYVVAFDATTGRVNTAFAPGLDGEVDALAAGPTPGTVYVGGQFSTAGGAKAKSLALLDLATGQQVPSFRTSAVNGKVLTLKTSGGRLFVGGTFTSFQGQPHGGLAAVDATTGVVDPFVQTTVLTNHNWTPTSTPCTGTNKPYCTAQAPVGVTAMDISPDGTRMVILGNFKTVDGQPRDQVAMLDLTGGQAAVRPDWQTNGYTPACYSFAFDSYVRDVQFSPDGTFFAIGATGAGSMTGGTTLCDAVARFETGGSGNDIKPSWVDYTGHDSIWSVAVTGSVVYAGGHSRWLNNPYGSDSAGPGAVPRPGIVALDAQNGVPVSWNPGRNPRGAGAYALLATDDGLYVGSDTDWIGNFQYRRMKVAYFPLAGGQALASTATPSLPGTVYTGGTPANSTSSGVLYRVDAGGSAIGSTDSGPDWTADNGTTSPYRNSGSNSSTYSSIGAVDSTVPAGTPSGIFLSERWDPGAKNDGGEMHWAFPVTAGKQVTVRLYFANQYSGTSQPGQRVFDVAIDGQTVLDHFDIVAAAGTNTGTMRSFPVTSDGTVDITFTHEVENPLINGIEIVDPSVAGTTPPTGTLSGRSYDGTTAGAPLPVASDLDWNKVRVPVYIGNWLYYGLTDGTFHRRTFDGSTFGPDQVVDPYNDPTWSTVDVGTKPGNTPVYYRGVQPAFYSQLSSITSAFYSDGRLYFTMVGSSALYYSAFSPDSGIISPIEQQVPGVSLPAVSGAFVSGDSLYYVDQATGSLNKLAFTAGTVTGPATVSGTPAVVSGPGVDGVDWRARSLFLGPSTRQNSPPVASASLGCTGLTCSFDGSGSTDPDGAVTGWSWNFGDGATATGSTASHTYSAAGTYPVVLTVTDDKGATSTYTTSATVAPVANQAPTAAGTASCTDLSCAFDGSASADPDGQVTAWSWDFGDGTTGSGATVSHTYTAAGTYPVVLTVTDDKGATATYSTTVSPTAPNATGISFRGVSDANVLGTSATVTVPSTVQPGDLLLLWVAGGGTTSQTPPAGWTQFATATDSGVLTTVWQRTAAAGDAGSQVGVAFGSLQKADVSLLAYGGAAAVDPSAVATKVDGFSAGSHTAPAVTASRPGSYALWLFAVRSSSTSAFSTPDGAVSRNASPGSGSGSVTTLAAESAQAVSGPVPGATSVADGTQTSGHTTMVSLVVAPAGAAAANQPPTAADTASCTDLTCAFDGSASADPDGHVASWSWDFGDGTTGSGATVSHAYAAAGTYPVVLTVTDDKGATATHTVTVTPTAPNATGVSFRGVSDANLLGTSATVTVPDTVQPGDLLLLWVAGGSTASQTPPAGWSQVATASDSGVLTTVWQRTAVAGDAGSPVSVGFASLEKSDVSLLAYSGAAAIDPAAVATAVDNFSAGSHTAPAVTATRPGSHALWLFAVRSSSSSAFSVPDGTVTRNASQGSGSASVTTLAAESAQAVSGPVPGATSVADGTQTSGHTTMVSLVIAPAS